MSEKKIYRKNCWKRKEEGSGKHSTMSRRGGGRSAAIAFRQENNEKIVAANFAGRAALRAAQRVNWMRMDPEMEICNLQKQLRELQNDDDVTTTEEYDCIMHRFLQLENQSKDKAATETWKAFKEANKTEKFTCRICLAKQPLNALQLIQPCGHGICSKCMSSVKICPICRGPKTEVLTTFL